MGNGTPPKWNDSTTINRHDLPNHGMPMPTYVVKVVVELQATSSGDGANKLGIE